MLNHSFIENNEQDSCAHRTIAEKDQNKSSILHLIHNIELIKRKIDIARIPLLMCGGMSPRLVIFSWLHRFHNQTINQR